MVGNAELVPQAFEQFFAELHVLESEKHAVLNIRFSSASALHCSADVVGFGKRIEPQSRVNLRCNSKIQTFFVYNVKTNVGQRFAIMLPKLPVDVEIGRTCQNFGEICDKVLLLLQKP